MNKKFYIIFIVILLSLVKKDTISFKENNMIVEKTPTIQTITNIKDLYPNIDIVGIINIPNTNINEPIVQGQDNEYYLNHDIFKQRNFKGAIFLDYRTKINESKKIIIYGHNAQSYNPPFKELEKYYDEDFAKRNRIIKILTVDGEKTYTIFAIFIATSDFTYINLNYSEQEWLDHLNYLKKLSFYDFEINLSSMDNILILQTCSFHRDYRKFTNKYLIIVAKEEKLS